MSISALAADERVVDVEITEDELSVRLMDGRTISVPLVWYPRLLNATEAQRKDWRIIGGGYGIHWEAIDEDLSTEGLLRGAPAPRQSLTQPKASPQEPEDQVSDNYDGVEGKPDYATEGIEAAKELNAIFAWIVTGFENLTANLNQHTSHIKQLGSKHGGSKASEYKKILMQAASDMIILSEEIEIVLPNFERNIQVLNESFSAHVALANPESVHDVKQVLNLRNSLLETLSLARQSKMSVTEFRDSVLVRGQKLSKELSKAASRQSQSLNGVISKIELLESFSLKIIFLIDSKFGKPPTSEDKAHQEG
jgi:hypothetical protein